MNELRLLLSELFDVPSPGDPFTWALVAAMIFARGMDFLSTWLVTPTLKLEANPLARRVGLVRMALLNLPLLGLPFLHHGLSITFVVTSLLVAGTNLTHGALARGMGEKRQLQSQMQALRRIGLTGALAMNTSGSLVVCSAGGFLMALGGGEESYPFWGGLGVVMFGVGGLVHLNAAIVRLHRRARQAEAAERKAQRQGRFKSAAAAAHRPVSAAPPPRS